MQQKFTPKPTGLNPNGKPVFTVPKMLRNKAGKIVPNKPTFTHEIKPGGPYTKEGRQVPKKS